MKKHDYHTILKYTNEKPFSIKLVYYQKISLLKKYDIIISSYRYHITILLNYQIIIKNTIKL